MLKNLLLGDSFMRRSLDQHSIAVSLEERRLRDTGVSAGTAVKAGENTH